MSTIDVDLNLLRVLDALLEEGSVTAAARKLHLSAPAVSRSLGRLRRALDDPLFVRSGRGLVPTPRAEQIRDEARAALDAATRVLSPASDDFDPSLLNRIFSISAGDAIVGAFGLRLSERLVSVAPEVAVAFFPDTNEADLLRSGEADVDIGSSQGFGPEIDSEVLFVDQYMAAVRVGHPLTAKRLTVKRYADADHLVVSSHGKRRSAIDDKLARLGQRRESITVVPSFIVALHMVADGDAVALLPSSVIRSFAQRLPVQALALPFEAPKLPVTQSWHRRNQLDPAHRWLRDNIRAISVELSSGT